MLSKKIFLEARKCLTKGWYHHSSGISIPNTEAEQFRINEGIEVGRMARLLYPHGILVNEGTNINNYEKTKQLLDNVKTQVIFEATFIYNNYIARVDILERIDGDWHLIEVKSKLASNKIEDELIDDLTYTTTILGLCGVHPKRISIFLVSKDFREGMYNKKFFVEKNCTEEVNQQRLNFINSMEEISNKTCLKDRPMPTLIFHCKDCKYFKEYCLGKDINNPIFDLPRLSEGKFNTLVNEKISVINHISEDFALTPPQKTVWNAVTSNKPILKKNKLRELLAGIIFPVYYLDFETVSTVIPIYPNIRPYQEIVTQYSIHKLSAIDNSAEPSFFLADYTKDDRRALATQLLLDIGKEGSVIVYHKTAEIKFINNLAEAVPYLAIELKNIINRIIDLEKILNETYYHLSFHGSYSIKKVLPILVPKMNYNDLEIRDGQTASMIFAKLARGKYTNRDAIELREQLLKYCGHDTLAMVEIHRRLFSLAD